MPLLLAGAGIAVYSFLQNNPDMAGNFGAILLRTGEDVIGNRGRVPLAEIPIAASSSPPAGLAAAGASAAPISYAKLAKRQAVASKKSAVEPAVNLEAVPPAPANLLSGDDASSSAAGLAAATSEVAVAAAAASELPASPARCAFPAASAPTHRVLLNEIAWMGNASSASGEWIELKNNSGADLSLRGMRLLDDEGNFEAALGDAGTMPAGALFLIERGEDAAPGVAADLVYKGNLPNDGMRLGIFDAQCALLDEIDARKGWPAGDNKTKRTMERNKYDLSWQTSAALGGTPKMENTGGMPMNIPAAAPSAPVALNPEPVRSESPPSPTASGSAAAGRAVVSEVMAGSDGNSSYEFIELYNAGDGALDLTGWAVKKKTASGAESALVAASRLEGKSIPPHRYFLLANEGGYAGPPAADVLWAKSNTLAYENNSIVLYDAAGNAVEEVRWAEIPKGSSYARVLPDGQFAVAVPTPQNSSAGQ